MTVTPAGRKLLRLEVRNAQTPIERKPPWIKTRAKMGPEYTELKSLVRREGTPALPLLGLGLAGAAMVLGWFLITAIVVGVTAVIILILSTVM